MPWEVLIPYQGVFIDENRLVVMKRSFGSCHLNRFLHRQMAAPACVQAGAKQQPH